jgi:hypothetical protein
VATTQPVHVGRAGLCCAVCVCACRPLITLALAVDAGIGPVQVGVAAVAPFCAACLTGISLGKRLFLSRNIEGAATSAGEVLPQFRVLEGAAAGVGLQRGGCDQPAAGDGERR